MCASIIEEDVFEFIFCFKKDASVARLASPSERQFQNSFVSGSSSTHNDNSQGRCYQETPGEDKMGKVRQRRS